MRRPGARSPLAGAALASVVAAACLAGCSSPTVGVTGAAHRAPAVVGVPLGSTLATTTGELAVVAMGAPRYPLDTFWQLFFRRPDATRWTLVTPPGVADNGGLVASVGTSSSGGAMLLAGFEPSQDLAFSPLALSLDEGGSWSPGLVPGGLAAVPDAVAVSPGAPSLALLRAGGGEVYRSTGNPTDWSEIAGRAALASSPAGRSCGVGRLTAVASDDSRGPLVGTTCTARGVVGIFGRADGTWRLIGPRLPGPPGSGATTVLRLVGAGGTASGLVAVAHSSATSVIGVAGAAVRRWSSSPPLSLGRGSRVVSTGVEPGGGFVVLASRPHRPSMLDVETGPGGAWHPLPAPPPGTAAVAVGTGGEVDALSVALVQLTDWRLDVTAGRWTKIDTVTVPIQFGSSS
ncbi:MAG TPA: hypothetical protein VN796_08735 [Acidimicrobiales bacterium]|nr:hypothetical protein [Acidimicrobiales bacterium]